MGGCLSLLAEEYASALIEVLSMGDEERLKMSSAASQQAQQFSLAKFEQSLNDAMGSFIEYFNQRDDQRRDE